MLARMSTAPSPCGRMVAKTTTEGAEGLRSIDHLTMSDTQKLRRGLAIWKPGNGAWPFVIRDA